MDLFDNIWKMVLFVKILFILFLSTECQEFDSIVFKDLYEKFRTETENQNELKVMQNLYEINERFTSFNYHFKSRRKGSEIQFKFIQNVFIKNIQKIFNLISFKEIINGFREGVSTRVSCLACHSIISFVFNTNIPIDTIGDVLVDLCAILKIPNLSVTFCKDMCNLFKAHIDYIRKHSHLKKAELCGQLFGLQCLLKSGKCFNDPIPSTENLCWKSNFTQSSLSIGPKKKSPNNNKIYRILHLTDIHVDPQYVPSTSDNCGQPYCCRVGFNNNSGNEMNPDAGYWGSYHCDPPIHLLENTFNSINWTSIDLVYWTGDVSAHEYWTDTWISTRKDSMIITNLLRKYSQSPVVPAIGNHVSVPVGLFAPPDIHNELSSKRIYQDLAKEWSHWIDSEALDTFISTGYHIKKLRPGFSIIAMNTNYCARLNFWTLYRSIDPADHLKWLVEQLDLAEKAGDSVHIIGHIPPDNRECSQSWLYNYLAIVERYSDTIVGQFFGHTHKDELRFLHSNSDCNKSIGYEILSPGLSSYRREFKLNPAYRIICTNYQGRIIDIDTFTFNLREANAVEGAQPNWYKEYSMAKDYSIGFGVQEFSKLSNRIIEDNYYLQKYYSHYTRGQPNSYCNTDCKTDIISDIKVCNPFDSIPKPITSNG